MFKSGVDETPNSNGTVRLEYLPSWDAGHPEGRFPEGQIERIRHNVEQHFCAIEPYSLFDIRGQSEDSVGDVAGYEGILVRNKESTSSGIISLNCCVESVALKSNISCLERLGTPSHSRGFSRPSTGIEQA